MKQLGNPIQPPITTALLIADVIPQEAMGNYIGLFRAAGAIGGFVSLRQDLHGTTARR